MQQGRYRTKERKRKAKTNMGFLFPRKVKTKELSYFETESKYHVAKLLNTGAYGTFWRTRRFSGVYAYKYLPDNKG